MDKFNQRQNVAATCRASQSVARIAKLHVESRPLCVLVARLRARYSRSTIISADQIDLKDLHCLRGNVLRASLTRLQPFLPRSAQLKQAGTLP